MNAFIKRRCECLILSEGLRQTHAAAVKADPFASSVIGITACDLYFRQAYEVAGGTVMLMKILAAGAIILFVV